MSDQLALTTAEVSFLLTTAEHSSALPGLLGILPDEQSDAVRAAGLASLVVRGLASIEGTDVHLSPAVAVAAAGLTQASTVLQVGLVAADRADGATVHDSGQLRLLVTPRPNRCLDVLGLDREVDIRRPLSQIIRGFVTEFRPAVATVRIERGSPLTVGHLLATPQTDPAPGFGWVTLAVGQDGAWSYADVEEQELRQGDEATAMARFGTVLGTLLSLPAAA